MSVTNKVSASIVSHLTQALPQPMSTPQNRINKGIIWSSHAMIVQIVPFVFPIFFERLSGCVQKVNYNRKFVFAFCSRTLPHSEDRLCRIALTSPELSQHRTPSFCVKGFCRIREIFKIINKLFVHSPCVGVSFFIVSDGSGNSRKLQNRTRIGLCTSKAA